MSELAFNINGESFDLPATASGWRVRRMKQRGAPEVVYGKDGVPLLVPIDAGLDELRALVITPGRYRLDAVDERGRSVGELPASYVVVPADVAPVASNTNHADGMSFVLVEAMRHNAELAKTVVDRFPQMMEAAASLLRAADGAGLPSREPRVIDVASVDDDNDDDNEQEAPQPQGFDLNTIVAQLVPMIMTSLMNGKLKVPGLAGVLDWRKAAPKANPAIATEDAASDPKPDESVEPMIPPLDPETIAHFMAIQAALKPEEASVARAVAADLAPIELRAWFDDLKKLSVPAGVAKIRALVGKKGGAS